MSTLMAAGLLESDHRLLDRAPDWDTGLNDSFRQQHHAKAPLCLYSLLLVHGPKTHQSPKAKDGLRPTSQRREARGTQSSEVFKVFSTDRRRAVSEACGGAAGFLHVFIWELKLNALP